MRVFKLCAWCGVDFLAHDYPSRIDRYCSKACGVAARPQNRPKPIAERFWKYVDKTPGFGPWGDCWNWTGYKHPNGYAQMGDGSPNHKCTFAHRVSWQIHFGEIPEGKWVLHKCDNPPCSNPDHLWIGDCADNMRDCSEKGRTSRGETHPSAKITDDTVREIRALAASGWKQERIAEAFGLQPQRVSRIVRREEWKHI